MEKFAPVKRSEDGQPVRYLIVDDSVFARKNLARMVETFGGQVIGEAGDGVSAISEYERLSPDIVLWISPCRRWKASRRRRRSYAIIRQPAL